ncbi:unnamed protein product [Ascophyllum nodosum]
MDVTTQQDQRPPQAQPQLGLQLPTPPPPAHEHNSRATTSSLIPLGDQQSSLAALPNPPPHVEVGLTDTNQQKQQQQQQQQQQQPGLQIEVSQHGVSPSQTLFHQHQQQQGAAALRHLGQQAGGVGAVGDGGAGGATPGGVGAVIDGQQQQQNLLAQAMSPQHQQQLMQNMYLAAMAQNPAAMMLMPYMTQYPMYSRMALPTDQVTEDPPTYVNAKQYRRIIKRREARAKLEARRKVAPQRKSFLHKSRHDHACRRVRGPGGRFLTKAELLEYRKQLEALDPEGATAPAEVAGPGKSKTQPPPPAPRNLGGGSTLAAPVASKTASNSSAAAAPLNLGKDPALAVTATTAATTGAGLGSLPIVIPSPVDGDISAGDAGIGHIVSAQHQQSSLPKRAATSE